MKKITFISALFLCMSLQMQASPVQTVTNPTQAKKGELPPAWVKNKVSYEQYAQLVEANKQRGIDYSALKGNGVSDEDENISLIPVDLTTETVSSNYSYYYSSASSSVLTKVAPAVSQPAMARLNLAKAKVRLTYTKKK